MILELLARHKAGEQIGLPSICSAHPLVIEAAFRAAQTHDAPFVLIEATCNQVNQEGGYTGMTPADFRTFVEAGATAAGYPIDRVVLGGDHLGPNPWTALPAAQAMAKAATMVADYVRAGFGKIHLDCSMACAGEASPLPEATIAERASILCAASEAAARDAGGDPPVYVIGTEVPVPGGAREDIEALEVTAPGAALATIAAHREAFASRGLDDAWRRVVALVVQPGVEFDHDAVIDYAPEAARELSAALDGEPRMVFEAHSTDYQTGAALGALVRDHFAILKVGPGVTFALREALWALDAIERETIEPDRRADLRERAIRTMREEPRHWRSYYHAEGARLDEQLNYSLSDRIRYYWPDAAISEAQEGLFANLREAPPTLALLSQYLPTGYAALRRGAIAHDPRELVVAHVAATLADYYEACATDA